MNAASIVDLLKQEKAEVERCLGHLSDADLEKFLSRFYSLSVSGTHMEFADMSLVAKRAMARLAASKLAVYLAERHLNDVARSN